MARDASRLPDGAFTDFEKNASRFVFSSGKGEVSDGRAGTNSPFAEAILKNLKTNEEAINIVLLSDQVTKYVSFNYAQRAECAPIYQSGHEGGQFVFFKRQTEKDRWLASLHQNTETGYLKYLNEYPDGQFVQIAEENMYALADEKAWKHATMYDSAIGYRDYLRKYPNGKHNAEARANIDEILGKDDKDKIEADRIEQKLLEKAKADKIERERLVKIETDRIERARLAKIEADRIEVVRLTKLKQDSIKQESLVVLNKIVAPVTETPSKKKYTIAGIGAGVVIIAIILIGYFTKSSSSTQTAVSTPDVTAMSQSVNPNTISGNNNTTAPIPTQVQNNPASTLKTEPTKQVIVTNKNGQTKKPKPTVDEPPSDNYSPPSSNDNSAQQHQEAMKKARSFLSSAAAAIDSNDKGDAVSALNSALNISGLPGAAISLIRSAKASLGSDDLQDAKNDITKAKNNLY